MSTEIPRNYREFHKRMRRIKTSPFLSSDLVPRGGADESMYHGTEKDFPEKRMYPMVIFPQKPQRTKGIAAAASAD